MARWAKVDFKQLTKLRDEVNKFHGEEFPKFQEKMEREMATRLVLKALKRTPTDTKDSPGIRAGWSIGDVRYEGGSYSIEVYNSCIYANSVEWGYLAKDGRTLIPGRFMLHLSEEELRQDADKVIEEKLMEVLRRGFP
ncbi:MAG: HK97 gp10 family phage protein [Anaerotignum propionicum]|uniref:HK97 gp10 family phage protein n=1 Tax=Anaerotignum propionicum TaxID=28446 RepID=UPI002B1F73B2|nr:HK97 gp10 family phage protein [Anaerotignum propionicum]MEA5057162.1 HK97 gp10 family phage protein [Anaerotignum propionicum]